MALRGELKCYGRLKHLCGAEMSDPFAGVSAADLAVLTLQSPKGATQRVLIVCAERGVLANVSAWGAHVWNRVLERP